MQDVVIAGAARTAMGGFQGVFSTLSAARLGGTAIAAALDGAKADREPVDEVIMGCVLPAGQGQAPARQAAVAKRLLGACSHAPPSFICGTGYNAALRT